MLLQTSNSIKDIEKLEQIFDDLVGVQAKSLLLVRFMTDIFSCATCFAVRFEDSTSESTQERFCVCWPGKALLCGVFEGGDSRFTCSLRN